MNDKENLGDDVLLDAMQRILVSVFTNANVKLRREIVEYDGAWRVDDYNGALLHLKAARAWIDVLIAYLKIHER